MAKIGFAGFPPGASVSISALQAGAARDRSVANWGQSNMGSVSIVERQSTLKVAPAGLWLEAIDILGFDVIGGRDAFGYDPSFHAITWIWRIERIDGPGGAVTDTAPLSLSNAATLNIPEVWKDPNIRYGREIGVALNDPGHYRFTLWCVDESGTTAEAVHEVEIAEADAFFPGGRTICYSIDGDFTGAPAGAHCVSRTGSASNTPSGATTTLNATDQTLWQIAKDTAGPRRMLLRRGQTYVDFSSYAGATMGETPWWISNIRMGAFGSGARPLLSLTDGYTGRLLWQVASKFAASEMVFSDIDITGTWDQANWTGRPKSPWSMGGQYSNCFFMLHRMNLRGVSAMMAPGSAAGNITTLHSEIDMTHIYSYSVADFGGGGAETTRGGMVACSVYHDPNAVTDLPGVTNQTVLAPVRITGEMKHFSADMVDLFQRFTRQPVLKHGTEGVPGIYGHISRIALEGGTNQFHQNHSDGSAYCTNLVIDQALFVGTWLTGDHVYLNAGGSTLRNILAFQRDADMGTYYNGFVFKNSNRAVSGTFETPQRFHNITYVCLLQPEDNIENTRPSFNSQYTTDSDWLAVTEENNIVHIPNLSSGGKPAIDGDAPLDLATAIAGFTPRDTGSRPQFRAVERTITGTLSNGQSRTFPWPNASDAGYDADTDETNAWAFDYFRDYDHGGLSFSSAGAAGFTVTNVSAGDLTGTLTIVMPRPTELPASNALQANPATIPTCRPVNDPGGEGVSAAVDDGDAGLGARLDGAGRVRPENGDERGWLLEA